MAQIRMSPETMRTRSSEVKAQGTEFEGVINKMQSIINELQTEWEGKASAEFAAQFGDVKPYLIKMKELIDAIGEQLNDAATAYEDVDQNLSGNYGLR